MGTKPKHRLHIDSITSVGVCEEGDNELAKVVLWKSKPTRSEPPSFSGVSGTAGGRGRSGSGRSLSPAERTALVAKVRLDRQAEKIEELKKSTAESQRTLDEIRRMRGTNMAGSEATAGSVRSEVDRLAASMVKKGEAATLVEGRAQVWRDRPDLVAKSRQEGPESVAGGSDKTITDRIREVIDEATRKASWQPLMQGWGDGKTREQVISKVRLEMWQTPDGRELRDLERKYGSKPYTPTTSREIRKSRGGGQYERALNLLDSGIWSG